MTSNATPVEKVELLRTRKYQFLGQASDDLKKTDHPKATSRCESEHASQSVAPVAQFRSSMETSQSSPFKILKRVPLTADQKHVVFHRYQGRCTHVDETGKRCGSDRWIYVLHIIEVSRGGTNEPSNLTLLRSFHHDLVHQLSRWQSGRYR